MSTTLPKLMTVFAACAVPLSGIAADLQVVDTFNFLDYEQANLWGPAHTSLSLGGDFSPSVGTTVTATLGSTTIDMP